MRNLKEHFQDCCINTATLGFREPIGLVADRVAAAGFSKITPWRQEIDENKPSQAASAIRSAGLQVSSYCRTTYLTASSEAERLKSIDSNRRALEVAATLGASTYVAVVGGLSDQSNDIDQCRAQILKGLADLIPMIEQTGVKILLEPLHPFYAADRSLLNTLSQAVDWCQTLDPEGKCLGIALDVYHVWWDPDLRKSLVRAGKLIQAFHVCDWRRNTQEPLLDRMMMGDGVIDIPGIRASVESLGYAGPVEVEIFSRDHWWKEDPDQVLKICKERLESVC
jgi:sugar phosphate isomerase/epimerase